MFEDLTIPQIIISIFMLGYFLYLMFNIIKAFTIK